MTKIGKIMVVVGLILIVVGTFVSFMSLVSKQKPPKNDFYQVEHLWRVKEVIAADSLEFKVYEVWRSNHWKYCISTKKPEI